ncbi:MAG: OB-fold domain-containing protein [Rhodospirillales bacterium]|nr:OB-fold domain-containing protein [Rhodospirillales bacterium]
MNETALPPIPAPSVETKPYWDGLAAHRLMIQACAECGKLRHYPRPVCDACFSLAVRWQELSGQGTVHSWTVTHHAFHPGFRDALPYTLVTVDLAEGVRLNAQWRGADPALRLGLAVRIGFEAGAGGFTLPVVLPD